MSYPKIAVVSTVHFYKNARVYFKSVISIKKKYDDLIFIVPAAQTEPFVENDVSIDPLPIPKSRFDRFIKNQFYIYKKLKNNKPDIIHFHVPELILLMLFMKKKFGCKIIFDVHENVPLSFKDKYWIPCFLKPILPFTYSKIEKIAIKSFDAVIIAETSYKKNYDESVIEILNYPIINNINNDLTKDFNGELKFVYVGNITKTRGIFKILDSFLLLQKKYNYLTLTLIGSFAPSSLYEQIIEFIAENNLQNNVSILGELPLNEVYEILNEMHFGYAILEPIGNYIESLPTKIFDYMSHGIPYVVSDFPIYKKYTIDSNTGIVADYFNTDEIVEKISKLIENREELSVMSENGKTAVKNDWNWESQEKKLLNLYKSLL